MHQVAIPYNLYRLSNDRIVGLDAYLWRAALEKHRILLIKPREVLSSTPRGKPLPRLVGHGDQLEDLRRMLQRWRAFGPQSQGQAKRLGRARLALLRLAGLFIPHRLLEAEEMRYAMEAVSQAEEGMSLRLAHHFLSLNPEPLGDAAWLNVEVEPSTLAVMVGGVVDKAYQVVLTASMEARRRLMEVLPG